MKKITMSLMGLAIASAALFAFSTDAVGTIKGKVNPADAAIQVWALSSADTVKAPVSNGMFELVGVKPGTYKLIVEAKPPYKNAAKEGVVVTEGGAVDAGEIMLQK